MALYGHLLERGGQSGIRYALDSCITLEGLPQETQSLVVENTSHGGWPSDFLSDTVSQFHG